MSKLMTWIDERFPATKMWEEHVSKYYAPKNFNFWYFFGSLALVVLVLQIITGIFLTMHYKPDANLAFASVEYIMRDVPGGWLVRYMHSTGASAFFVVIYLHMFRALIYGSYKGPRELLWIFGMLIYVALMAEGFMGYLLPWGQMSFWGAQVIINLFGAIPFIGEDLSIWIRGDYVISDATLNRFFALHVIAIPLAIVGLVVAHILALHEVGSNNPDGVEIKKNKGPDGIPKDGIPFHPYYTVHDLMGLSVFFLFFFGVVFFAPEMGGYFLEYANFVPADPLKTPEHIAPVWYFTPFYTVLRAVPHPFGGVLAMGGAIFVLFFLPWIDKNPIKSWRYRTALHKINILIFAVVFVILGYLGVKPVSPLYSELGLRLTEMYFLFFVVLWFYSRPRSANFTWILFGGLMVLIIVLDALRFSGLVDEQRGYVFTLLVLPLLYLALTLLGTMFAPRLNKEKPVPERITVAH